MQGSESLWGRWGQNWKNSFGRQNRAFIEDISKLTIRDQIAGLFKKKKKNNISAESRLLPLFHSFPRFISVRRSVAHAVPSSKQNARNLQYSPVSHKKPSSRLKDKWGEKEAEPESSQGRIQTAVVERRNVRSCPVLLCSCCLRCACSSLPCAVPAVSSIPGWLRPWCWCCEPCCPASAPCSPWTCWLGWNPLCPWRTSTPLARTRGTPRPSLRTTEAPDSWRSLLLSPSLETGTQDSMWVQSSVFLLVCVCDVCIYVFICQSVCACSWQVAIETDIVWIV